MPSADARQPHFSKPSAPPRGRQGDGGGIDVLVVEHDPTIARELTAALAACGYVVRRVTTGQDGLREAARKTPGLLLVDLELPDIDGNEVCRLIRRHHHCPIVALCPRENIDFRVRALDLGADDVVDQPPSIPELLARLRVARRHHRSAAAVVPDSFLSLGDLRIDLTGRQVRVGEKPVELTRTEFELLVLFVRNPDKVLGHQSIIEQISREHRPPLSTSPRVHVCNLRRKLGHSPGLPDIVTETGVGYRLVSPPEVLAPN